MAKDPAFLFYPGDWLTDPQLSLCTPATRGVWIDLLCAIHKLDRGGELCGTPEQLARIARCSPVELGIALTELQTTGTADVSERNGAVRIVSRRMYRDAKLREEWRLQKQRQRRPQDVRNNSPGCPASLSSSLSSSSSISNARAQSSREAKNGKCSPREMAEAALEIVKNRGGK
jgi:hypothetical protein